MREHERPDNRAVCRRDEATAPSPWPAPRGRGDAGPGPAPPGAADALAGPDPPDHRRLPARARLLGLPAFYLLHPLAALALAATAAFAFGIVADQVEGRPGGDLAALAAPVVLLWPSAYTLGQFTSDFFLAQMFGLTCLLGALYWVRGRSPLAPIGLVALGAGLVFSYPTLLP